MGLPEKQRSGSDISRLLIGRPLETQALSHQSVSRPIGLAVFASDALSSTAYATEEILIILALAGTGSAVLGLSLPIAIAIAALIIVVTVSYRQTIYAYPNGGGAYIVARDNLGEIPAQIAGAALLTDYILTVAVSISAGVAQVTSALPVLLPYRVPIALGLIFLMMMINLRGVKESGTVFAIPTYFFLGMMFLMLAVGGVRYAAGNLPVVTGVEPVAAAAAPLTLFLLLRAFSSGCTALTGIEAISNGITAFKEPRSRNAATTLIWMSSILITLFLGITVIANLIEAVPGEAETVISQIARTVYGRGSVLYLLTIAGTMLILIMAANTSFADFPRLAALAAGDGFLPRQLTYRGNRLVLSWGIIGLAVFASILVFITGAQTTALIPLYAIGVFLSFTISQTGMVVHLWRLRNLKPGEQVQGYETTLEHDPAWRFKMILSAVGAFCTFVVMIIFGVTKFVSGAWFVVILIPTLVLIFFRIHQHYKQVARALSTSTTLESATIRPITTLVLIDDVHAGTLRVLNFARSMGHPWQAIHIAINPEKAERTLAKWEKMVGEPELIVIPSPYRHLAAPLREYVRGLLDQNPESYVHIVMGHLAMESFWEQALHQNSAFVLNVALTGLDRVVFTQIPYQIHDGELINVARRTPPGDTV